MRADDGSACAYVCVCIKEMWRVLAKGERREEMCVWRIEWRESARERSGAAALSRIHVCVCVCIMCERTTRELLGEGEAKPQRSRRVGCRGVGGRAGHSSGGARLRRACRVSGAGGETERAHTAPLVEYVFKDVDIFFCVFRDTV